MVIVVGCVLPVVEGSDAWPSRTWLEWICDRVVHGVFVVPWVPPLPTEGFLRI